MEKFTDSIAPDPLLIIKNSLSGIHEHVLNDHLHIFISSDGIQFVFHHAQVIAFVFKGKVYAVDKYATDSDLRKSNVFLEKDFKTLHSFVGGDGTEYPENHFYRIYWDYLQMQTNLTQMDLSTDTPAEKVITESPGSLVSDGMDELNKLAAAGDKKTTATLSTSTAKAADTAISKVPRKRNSRKKRNR